MKCNSLSRYKDQTPKYFIERSLNEKDSVPRMNPRSQMSSLQNSYQNYTRECWRKYFRPTKKKPKNQTNDNNNFPTKFWYSSTSTNTEGAQPEITMPPSPPPTSSTAGSHVRRGQRNDKHNRYKKAQTTANLATPRRPLHTPTSSPLTISSGLSNFMSPRIRLVQHI